MKILIVALHDLQVRLKDRAALFLTFLAPMLVIALAALSFAHLGSEKTAVSQTTRLAIINADNHIGKAQFDRAIALMAYSVVIQQTGQQPENEVSTLTIPADFSGQLTKTRLSDERSQLNIEVRLATDEHQVVIADFIRQLALVVTGELPQKSAVSIVDVPTDNQTLAPSALSLAYFAPSMMTFFLMYAAFGGTRVLLNDKESGLLARLMYLPVAPFSLLLGKILAVFVVALLQLLILILCSALLPGMDWGNSWVGLALLCLCLAAAFTAFGIFIAIYAKDANQANVLGTGVILLFSLLGGNFVPVELFPDWLRQLGLISINRWGLDGIFDLTVRHQPLSGVLLEAAVLAVFALVFFGLSLWRFERQVTR